MIIFLTCSPIFNDTFCIYYPSSMAKAQFNAYINFVFVFM